MKGKIFSLILALVLIGAMVAIGCAPKPAPAPAPTPAPAPAPAPAPKPSPAPSPSPTPAPAPKPTPSPTPAQPAQVIKWIAQDDNPTTNPTYISLDKIAKEVEKASGGRLLIQANPGGAIVPSDAELEPTSKGVLQMGSNGPILWKPNFAQAPLFSTFIGGPTAIEYFMWYQVGEGFSLMKEMLATKSFNVTLLAAEAELPEVFLYTNYPITNLDAVKGKKMRLLGDEAVIFGKLGVSAVATPSGEIYEAMKRGVIDGFQHSNLGTDEMMGFHEVAKYAYMGPTRQATDMYILYANTDAFNKLPDDLKRILIDVCWAEGINHYSTGIKNAVNVADKWKKAGVNIAPVPQFFEDAVVKSAMEFYAEMKSKDPLFAKIYDSLIAWKNLVDAAFPRL